MRELSPNEYKIGLVLGGGGARGLAHIGVLKVLEREQIPISYIAGTSMGGLIGALYAAGISLDAIEAEIKKLSPTSQVIKLVDLKLAGVGLQLKGTRIYNYLATFLGEDCTFNDLNIPVGMVAVDTITGREVILREGRVVDAIRATISVPGIFSAVQTENLLLVDGGILNNVPVDVVRGMGANRVIAVDVLPFFGLNKPGEPVLVEKLELHKWPRTVSELLHVQMIMVSAITQARLSQWPPEVLVRPDLPTDTTLFSGFNRVKELVAAGVMAAESALPEIRALVDLQI